MLRLTLPQQVTPQHLMWTEINPSMTRLIELMRLQCESSDQYFPMFFFMDQMYVSSWLLKQQKLQESL
jgi:hypothetical protein